MYNMFRNCHSLTSLDLSHFKTGKVVSMEGMFENCRSLTTLILSSFNTEKLEDMDSMFSNCQSLSSITLTNFDTKKVNSMIKLFYNCNSLKEINLLNFDTSEVTTMKSMFEKCTELTVLNISNFITNKCSDYSQMFLGCTKLEYVNFYNFYEDENTIYNDIIKDAHSDIKICIHTTNESRIYGNHGSHLEEECLIKKEIEKISTEEAKQPTTEIDTTEKAQETQKEPSTQIDTTEKIEHKKSSSIISDTSDQITKSSTEKIEKEETDLKKDTNDSKEIKENKSTSEIKSNTHINDITQINTAFSDYIVINDTIIFYIAYNNTQIYNKIIENMMQSFYGLNGNKLYIKGVDNFIFEITTEENEIELLKRIDINERKLSIIDLDECHNLLKSKYYPNINQNISFIILKHEKLTNVSSEKSVQYEVYDPFNFTKLDISICQNVSVNIHIPAQLSNKTQKLIEDLLKLGYDVFNINDPFYQDFCTKYTSEGGTDMTLTDRKKYIYEAIMSEVNCQENCEFASYDPVNRNIECKCKVEENINTVDYKKFSLKKLHNTFYDVLKYSNYKVIYCYKLVFNKDIFGYNKGFWFLFILFLLYLTQMTIYIFKKISPLKLNVARYHFKKIIQDNKNEQNNIYEVAKEKVEMSGNSQLPPKKRKETDNSLIFQENIYEGRNSDNNILKSKSKEKLNIKKKSSNFKRNKENELNNINNITKIKIEDSDQLNLKKGKLDNFELNDLEYEEALILDKRNMCQIYWSLLKREHLIIFTFFYHNDYNLYYVKLARFIFLLATDMAMNVFFFSDETMNKLYLSYGKYDFVQQIPQIIYSKLLSNIIEVFLCFLSLTDKHYYQIKSLNKSNKQKIFNIIKIARVKLIIFFVFTFIVFLFYLYLVTAFCAVYENTEMVYLKDSLSSFAFGFLEPFVIYFIPTFLRIISLRCKCIKLNCFYTLSELIPIF